MNRKEFKRKHFAELAIVLAVVILVNFLSGIRFFRLDMSSEKRYSLNHNSREILKNINDVVYIKVFLDGDLPSDLLRFRQAIKEILLEFRAYAGKNIG